MIGNAKNGNPGGKVTQRPLRAVIAREKPNKSEHRVKLDEIGRRYTLQAIVTDQVGREVLNLTKVCLERDLPGRVNTTPEIHDVLELLVEAAGEWCA